MSLLQFIIDTQLPPKMALFLNDRGHDAFHTIEFPNGVLTKDEEIIKIAVSQNRIIVTKDHDFLNHFLIKGPVPKILLIETGNINNNDLFELIGKQLERFVEFYEFGSGLIVESVTNCELLIR